IEGGRALTARIRQAGEELVSLTATIIGAGNDDLAEVADPDSATARFPGGQGTAAGTGSRGTVDEFDPANVTPFAQLLEG
ncbi:MAG TPA: flavoprotein, partial [Brevibacterium linens]|nr:flavoprotein [Brevibacterium linens]